MKTSIFFLAAGFVVLTMALSLVMGIFSVENDFVELNIDLTLISSITPVKPIKSDKLPALCGTKSISLRTTIFLNFFVSKDLTTKMQTRYLSTILIPMRISFIVFKPLFASLSISSGLIKLTMFLLVRAAFKASMRFFRQDSQTP